MEADAPKGQDQLLGLVALFHHICFFPLQAVLHGLVHPLQCLHQDVLCKLQAPFLQFLSIGINIYFPFHKFLHHFFYFICFFFDKLAYTIYHESPFLCVVCFQWRKLFYHK